MDERAFHRIEAQRRLSDAIQAAGEGEVLVGWLLVSEWVGSDGQRRLRLISGPEDLPDWQVAGYLHAGLAPAWRERRERGTGGAT